MKAYISADMEGVAGVVTDAQLGPEGFDWPLARTLYTDEVLAVADQLKEGGVTEITVSDSHGTGQNLLIDRFPPHMRLIQAWPRPLGMMEGIDSSFDAAILLGYHSGAHNARGGRAHTMSSANLFEVAINGTPVCEAEISAYIAGHFDVPIVMLSGDDAIAAEISTTLPQCETATTKRSLSFHSSESLSPAAAHDVLRQATSRAMARKGAIDPTKLEGPITLDVVLKNHRPAELLGYLPNVERVDAHRVRFVGKDILEVSAFLEFVLNYSPDLRP